MVPAAEDGLRRRPLKVPVARRLLLGLFVVTLLSMLAVEGYVADMNGRSGIAKIPSGVAPLARSGPVLFDSHGVLVSMARARHGLRRSPRCCATFACRRRSS